MEEFIDEFVLDDDGIYGALCEEVVGFVADSVEELDDADFDMESCEDEDDIILSMMGVNLDDVEDDEID